MTDRTWVKIYFKLQAVKLICEALMGVSTLTKLFLSENNISNRAELSTIILKSLC